MNKKTPNLLPEAALIYCLPVLFIGSYVWIYHNPAIAIIEHLYIVTLLFVAAISLKVLIHQFVSHKKLASIISANVYAVILSVFIIYYALVFIGLQSWHRVITQEFIISYSQQARSFSEVLGISLEFIFATLVLSYIAIVVFCFYFFKKTNWLPEPKVKSSKLFSTLTLSIFLFSSYWFNDYLGTSHKNSREPVSLTLNTVKSNLNNRGTNLDASVINAIDMREENARKKYIPNINATRRNLIIIMVDALRPDHTGVYGYNRDTTPHLNQLVLENTSKIFTNVHSTCGETTCAHASFFSSRYTHQLPSNLFTLQELLKKYDYSTNFIISGDHINFNNIREVYGEVDNYYDGTMQLKYFFNDDYLITDKTKSLPNWDGKPTMIYYHLLSNHVLGKRHDAYFKFTPFKNYALRNNGSKEIEFTNFYDNGVFQTDSVIDTLIKTLKSKKYLENSLVVIMADHGESLGEHHLFAHSNSVYEEALNIPLILIPYGYQSNLADQDDQFMSIVDVAPTILHDFDMPNPVSWIGQPVQTKQTKKYSFFQMAPNNGFFDLTDNKNILKYWQNEITFEEFAFNVSNDPKEESNIFSSIPANQKNIWRSIYSSNFNK